MNEDEMIIPEGDAPADTSQNNDNDSGKSTAPVEVEGTLLDNDEVEDAPADDDGRAQRDSGGAVQTEGESDKESQENKGDTGASELPGKTTQAPQPAAQLEDPGEFQPKDYSFDIELGDGTKLRIAKPEDIENLPADADFGSPKNLMQAQANYNKMVLGIDADKREHEASKAAYDKQVADSADVEQRVTTMMNEMAYLETKGKLPAVDDKYKEADWSDAEVAKQPGVKERLELIAYRAKENEERTKLGLSPMSLLEAHMQMAQDQAEQKAADEKQKQGEQRKAKGAVIGGASASHFDSTPDDMIVGEGGSIRDIGRN